MKLIEDLTGYVLVANNNPNPALPGTDEALEAYHLCSSTIQAFWHSVNRGEKVTCCEVVANEHRFKVCAGMPESIEAYVDYIEPREEPAPVEMQYINRRLSDGALWPTMFPITAPGWEQIGCRPIQAGYHSEDDTILVYSGHTPRPADKMTHVRYSGYFTTDKRIWTKNGAMNYANDMPDILAINFSKGDHLSESEREAWHQEATGFQESYYSTFQK